MKPVSVTQVNEYLANKIDSDFNLRDVAIEGEISGLTRKGHAYFSLKDEQCVIRSVVWKSQLPKIDPELLEDGRNVVAVGSVRLYAKGGTYSFQIHYMEDAGVGKAKTAFEALKKKLEAEGLFRPEYKKPLPEFPECVGVVTSTEGDALRDIQKIILKKNNYVNLLIFPTYVQGVNAPASICQGIHLANRVNESGKRHIDLLIVGRGGGSPEDLAAFNEESVARAIFQSDIPIISAVGHEPDVSISDYVADARGATPSEAADMAVPDVHEIQKRIAECRSALSESLRFKLLNEKRMVESLTQLLCSNMRNRVQKARNEMEQALIKLREGNPKRVLERGFAAVLNEAGTIVSDIDDVSEGEEYTVLLRNGRFKAQVTGKNKEGHDE